MAFEEEDPPGAPEWIVTFSDMISLLVTFFVLLLSFASVAAKDEARMKQFLRGMWGLFPAENGAAVEAPIDDISPDQTYRTTASTEKSSRPFEEVLHELERAGLRENDERIPIDLAASTSGIRLKFGEAERFEPGDDRVSAQLESALVRIADVVRNYPYEIVVEGQADAGRVANARFSEPDALSLARAAASAAVLTRSGKLNPLRVSLSTASGAPSIGSTETASTPAHDSSVELRLVPVVVP
jgi:chemotaxis protein MotB